MRNAKGFTLIELSIVLIIIGIIMGLGIGVVGPLLKGAKIKQAQDYLEGAIQSVISFGMGNQRLPNAGEFPTGLRNPNDPWGNQFWYVYDNKTATTSEGGICGRKSTNLRLAIIDATTGTTTNIDNVAFIVFSGGANYNNQTAGPTGDAGTSAGVVTINTYLPLDNPNVQVDNYAGDVGGARNEPYDDIVKWVTLSELRIKANCTGSQLTILNDSLPYGQLSTPYSSVNVFANGGAPYASGGKYKWCIQNTAGVLAPTGITYQTTGGANIPFSANCQGLAEESWSAQSDHVVIAGNPSGASSSNNLTFFVRDNNDPVVTTGVNTTDNIGQKTFVLTIYPYISGGASYAPSGSQTSFANNMSGFSTPASSSTANSVIADTATNTVALGNNLTNTKGCVWYPTGQRLDNATVKAYFEFKNANAESTALSNNSATYGYGFTFAFNESADTNACGNISGHLGFDGLAGSSSVAIEFDTYPNRTTAPQKKDPPRAGAAGNSYNHVAIVKNGSNTHDNATGNPNCDNATAQPPGDAGCAFGDAYTVQWLENSSSTVNRVRVEIDHGHADCNAPGLAELGNRTGNSRIQVWVNCQNCNDLSQASISPGTTPTVKDCFDAGITSYLYGFTEGTGGVAQNLTIQSFGISFYPYP